MILLKNALQHWSQADFNQVIKAELLSLPASIFPLQDATTQGGLVDANKLDLTILSCSDSAENILIRTGIFFTEIIAGCNCNDDPVEAPAYCLVSVDINKNTAEASFSLLLE
ncbi:MAG: glucosamine--fructose-6-phosphate aminotransferase [Gammaproteobacteria bacterium]|nr:glucosamine--fructose-6-phosphate aminotransferase [Gammaproteobacteria bacterium]